MKKIKRAELMNTSSLVRPLLLLGTASVLFGSGPAHALDANALPQGGNVVGGSATIAQSGNTLNVNQSSNRAIIDWRSFNIGSQAQTNFNQPGSSSIAVNRVNASANPSQIQGTLNANGQVWILNPNGVFLGKTAQVNVAGIVASTANIDDKAFMAGSNTLHMTGADHGAVVNEGNITVGQGGLAAFVAPSVRNSGVIQATVGKVTLAAGDTYTLDLAGDHLVEIGLGATKAVVDQSGKIVNPGGTIEISAKAAGQLVDSLINMSGVTDASSAHSSGGKIILAADDITTTSTAQLNASAGGAGNGGTISAVANNTGNYAGSFTAKGGATSGHGGSIETSGATVNIDDNINVNTLAANGAAGSWTLDPNSLTVGSTGGGTITGGVNDDGSSNIKASTVVAALNTTDVVLQAKKTIEVDSAIDASGNANAHNLSLNDQDGGGLTINLNAAIALKAGGLLNGQGTTVNVTNTGLIQNGIDVALAGGATVNVGAGTYNEDLTIAKSGITLLSTDGSATTTIQGVAGTAAEGTIFLTPGSDNTTIGSNHHGFTIVGFDNSNPGIEVSAIYVQGNNAGSSIVGNHITAAGDEAILTEYGANVSGLTINNNAIDGQTFVGPNPAGQGSSQQFTLWNVPRQAVVIQTGASNTIFTNNVVTTVTGGLNISGQEQGNNIVSIDSAGATITGNTFAGTTDAWYDALRARGTDTEVSGNIFNGANMGAGTNMLELNDSALTTDFADIVASNTFTNGSAWVDHSISGVNYVFHGIQSAVTAATAGDTVNVGAGVYTQALDIEKNLDLVGAGIGQTIIQPTALLDTGVGHKYDTDVQAAVFVNGASDVNISGVTIDANNLGANAVVFWNNASGSISNSLIENPMALNGAQTGQDLAVDATGGTTSTLSVTDVTFKNWNKNAIDAVTGDGSSSGGGNIALNVSGSSFTGAGATGTIAQNGILLWEMGGASSTVSATVDSSTFSKINYTGPDASVGILQYGSPNGTLSVSNSTFGGNVQTYIATAGGSTHEVNATDNNTFGGTTVSGATSLNDLFTVENKISDGTDDSTNGLVRLVAGEVFATAAKDNIQAAIDVANADETVNVQAGTYTGALDIEKNIDLEGAGIGQTIIRPTALLDTGVGHKYDADVQAAVFVNGANNVAIDGVTIDANDLGANAVVFWNNASGTIGNSLIENPVALNGAQTGQDLAVDATGGNTSYLTVSNVTFQNWNKNAIDAVTGDGSSSGGGNIELTVNNGTSFTGAGATGTIAQNGILLWEMGGATSTVDATVDDSTFAKINYTGPNASVGVLQYGSPNGTLSVSNSTFGSNVQTYISTAGGSTNEVDATNGNSFGGVAVSAATPLNDLYNVEDKISDGTDDPGNGLVRLVAGQVYATAAKDNIQNAVDVANGGDTVNVQNGDYSSNDVKIKDAINLDLGSNVTVDSLTVTGAGAGTNLSGKLFANSVTLRGAVGLDGDLTLDTSGAVGSITTASVDGTGAGGQNLTLKAGGGSVSLGNLGANIALGTITDNNDLVTLTGKTYDANAITFGGNVILTKDTTIDVSANNGAIILASVDGDGVNPESLTLKAGSGTVSLGDVGDIVALGTLKDLNSTTLTGRSYSAADFNFGDLTLNRNTVITATDTGNANGDVIIASVNGDNSGIFRDLTITSNGSTVSLGDVGQVRGVGAVDDENSTTLTGRGYDAESVDLGAVILTKGNTIIDTDRSGGPITLASVDGDGNAENLTLKAGSLANVTLGDVGDNNAVGTLTAVDDNQTNLVGSQYSGGSFEFGDVVLKNDVTLSTNGGDVTMGPVSGTGPNRDLTIQANGGTVTLNDLMSGLANVTDENATLLVGDTYNARSLDFGDTILGTVGGHTTLTTGGDITLASVDGNHAGTQSLTLNAGGTAALGDMGANKRLGDVTDNGLTTLNGRDNEAGSFAFNGAVKLKNNVVLDTSAADGDISMVSVDGSHNLTLKSGAGFVSLGDVGDTVAVGTVTADNVGGVILTGTSYKADNFDLGATFLDNDTTIDTTSGNGGSGGNVILASVDNDTGVGPNSLTINTGSGQSSIGNLGALGALNAVTDTGNITLTGGDSYNAASFDLGAVTLDGNSNATQTNIAATGDVSIGSLDGVVGNESVAISSNSLELGDVGDTQHLDIAAFNVGGGKVTLTGSSYAATELDFGEVALGNDASLSAGAVNMISVDGSGAGGQNLTVDADQVIVGQMGANVTLGNVAVINAGLTILAGATNKAASFNLGDVEITNALGAGTISLDTSAANGSITLGSVDGFALAAGGADIGLNLNAGSGAVSLGSVGSGAHPVYIGVSQPIGALQVTAGATTLAGAVYDADSLDFTGPVILTTNTGLNTKGALILASVDGSNAGGQALSLNSGTGTVSLGNTGAHVALGALTDASNTTLTGSSYNAKSFTFGGAVTLVSGTTTLNTTQAGSAGDITFNGNIFGTASGAQSLVLTAGPGTGAASTNGNILLQNAGTTGVPLNNLTVSGNNFTALTVDLAGSYLSQLSGNQVFAADTLNAGGNMTSNVAGNATGHIVVQGAVLMNVGGNISGVISGNTLVLNANTITNSTLTGITLVDLDANSITNTTIIGPQVDIVAGTIDADITATNLDISAQGAITGTWSTIDTRDSVNLTLNGELSEFNSQSPQQLVVEGFALPPGTVINANGTLILPAGLLIGLLSPGGGEPRVVLVHSVQELGELLSEGYSAIVIDLSGRKKDEKMQLASN